MSVVRSDDTVHTGVYWSQTETNGQYWVTINGEYVRIKRMGHGLTVPAHHKGKWVEIV